MQHPREQIDLGGHSQRLQRALLIPLGHHRSAVPLEEPVQDAEGRVHGDLDELAVLDLGAHGVGVVLLGRGGQPHVAGIGDHLGDLAEVEHDVRDGALSGRAAVGQSAQDVSEGDEADESLARGSQHGQLVESAVAHDLNGVLARDVGADGGDRLQAERVDLRTGEGVSLLGLRRGRRRRLGGRSSEETVGREPVVIGEL